MVAKPRTVVYSYLFLSFVTPHAVTRRDSDAPIDASKVVRQSYFAIGRHKASVVMQRLSYPTETVLSNNINRNRIQGSRIRLVRGLVKFVPAH